MSARLCGMASPQGAESAAPSNSFPLLLRTPSDMTEYADVIAKLAAGAEVTESQLQVESYSRAQGAWPRKGLQLLAQYDADTVVLYRACCKHLGPHAASSGNFEGSPCYEKDRTRMMWFDCSFLTTMHRSRWGTKKNRDVVVALWVRRSFFEECLANAVCSDTLEDSGNGRLPPRDGAGGQKGAGKAADFVRLHWEPDRLPSGEKHRRRRVMQLGLKGRWLDRLGSGQEVVRVTALTRLLSMQRDVLSSDCPQKLLVPKERVFDPSHLSDDQLEALHMVSERSKKRLRILMLHGWKQNAETFTLRTAQLAKKLKGVAELVYVDAPHCLDPPRERERRSPKPGPAAREFKGPPLLLRPLWNLAGAGEGCGARPPMASSASRTTADTSLGADSGDVTSGSEDDEQEPESSSENQRTWWYFEEDAKRNVASYERQMTCEYRGLQESLRHLEQVWNTQGPFDGLLGFSQGAAMASIFHHCSRGLSGNEAGTEDLALQINLDRPPKFAICISGYCHPYPAGLPSYPSEEQYTLPTLHFWTVDDPYVCMARSQRLAGLFQHSVILVRKGRHCVPQKQDNIPHFRRFLEGFR